MVVLQKEGSCSQKSRITNSSFCEFFLLLSLINCSFFFSAFSIYPNGTWLAQKFTKFRKLIAKI
jgi:hypothetical protein